MKWSQWLEQWNFSKLKVNIAFLEMEFTPNEHDRNAAWEMYIELLTRIPTVTTLLVESDNKNTALNSIYSLFVTTRRVIRDNTYHASEFAKISILVLNQIIRPFTTKWHKQALNGGFTDPQQCKEFQEELNILQRDLKNYTSLLGDMAGIEEDLTLLERTD